MSASGDRDVVQPRVVLLAIDDSAASSAAIRVARALADEHDARIHVLHVTDGHSPSFLRDRIEGTLRSTVRWQFCVQAGLPRIAIAQFALEIGARLIVMGLRRHAGTDRPIQDESTLNTVRRSPCPVLAVAEGATTLPAGALAAMRCATSQSSTARMRGGLVGSIGTELLRDGLHTMLFTPHR